MGCKYKDKKGCRVIFEAVGEWRQLHETVCNENCEPEYIRKHVRSNQKVATELEKRGRERKRICNTCTPRGWCPFKKRKGWPSWCGKRNREWAFCPENKWPVIPAAGRTGG